MLDTATLEHLAEFNLVAAVAYSEAYGVPFYFMLVEDKPRLMLEAVEFEPGFVVGRLGHRWVVTHLGTASAQFTTPAESLGEALKVFYRVREDVGEEVLARFLERGTPPGGAQLAIRGSL